MGSANVEGWAKGEWTVPFACVRGRELAKRCSQGMHGAAQGTRIPLTPLRSAKGGLREGGICLLWIPACAGMTVGRRGEIPSQFALCGIIINASNRTL